MIFFVACKCIIVVKLVMGMHLWCLSESGAPRGKTRLHALEGGNGTSNLPHDMNRRLSLTIINNSIAPRNTTQWSLG